MGNFPRDYDKITGLKRYDKNGIRPFTEGEGPLWPFCTCAFFTFTAVLEWQVYVFLMELGSGNMVLNPGMW